MSETTAPAVSRQATRALQVANHVRRERAKLKTRIANGDLAAADIILSSPHEIDTMPVAQLLASQRGWGQTRSRAALLRLGVREDKRIGSLTARQRNAIASLLDRQRPPRRDQRAVTAPPRKTRNPARAGCAPALSCRLSMCRRKARFLPASKKCRAVDAVRALDATPALLRQFAGRS